MASGSHHSVTNVQQFFDKLKDVTSEKDEAKVSVDVTEPFASNDLDQANKVTRKYLQKHYTDTSVET